ncbi:MAG: triose-phosphate isomerase, partial [Propionibacteriaceae bacterium]|nr:triose-phosphate isomerase [Propionibacteriaceae bacterium]
MAARLPLMAGNWKMNNDHVEATGLVQNLAWTLADLRYDKSRCEAAVIVPFTDIRTV